MRETLCFGLVRVGKTADLSGGASNSAEFERLNRALIESY
jgi:hypothetical protein